MSDKIEKNFSKKIATYDSYAVIQKIMAKNLFKLIQDNKKRYEIIFEIGCGTGILTQHLINLNPSLLILNDISENMLETVKNNIQGGKIVCINGDFLKIKEYIKNELIASNATFQWIFDLNSLFAKINNLLLSNGILAFSIFIEGTFSELDRAFYNSYLSKGLQPKKHTLDFYSKENIKELLIKNNLEILKFIDYDYKINYDTPQEFLRSIHNIGATVNNEERVNYSIMKKMLQEYKNLFPNDNKVYATYNVLYVIAKKKETFGNL